MTRTMIRSPWRIVFWFADDHYTETFSIPEQPGNDGGRWQRWHLLAENLLKNIKSLFSYIKYRRALAAVKRICFSSIVRHSSKTVGNRVLQIVCNTCDTLRVIRLYAHRHRFFRITWRNKFHSGHIRVPKFFRTLFTPIAAVTADRKYRLIG